MARSFGPDALIPQQQVSHRSLASRSPRVTMVQTTDLEERNDPAASGRFNGPGIRRVLAESKVRPGNVVVAEIAFQDSSQMVLVEEHHMVQAFTPNGPDDAFDIRTMDVR